MKSQLLTVFLVILISAKSFCFAVNDSCQSATLLTVKNSGSSFTPLIEDLNQSSSVLATICATSNYMDLWYYFVATNDTQVVFLRSLTVGLLPSTELLTGNCGALTSVNCYNGGVLNLYSLTVGQTYYLRTYYFSSGMRYEISLLNVPSNDVCNTAYNLNVYRDDQPHVAGLYFWTAASNAGINLCNPPWNPNDIWFKFTATDTAQVLYIDGIAAYLDFEVYSGNCGSLVSKQCGTFSNTDHAKFRNLTIGQQYYFRILTDINNQYPLFKVALLDPVSNDYCGGAITLPMSASFADDNEVPGDLWFGFPSTGTCNSENDLWYKFTANSASAFVKVQSFTPVSFSVYSGSCGSLTALQCSIPANRKVTGLTSGNTYYVQLHSSLNTQQFFSIAVTPILGNDDCSGAITVTPSDKLFAEFPVEATTFSATQSQPGCAGNADDDVWFKFTANRTEYNFEVTTDDVNLFNPGYVYELFSGSCGSLTSIKCDTVKSDVLDRLRNLTLGQTYYLRLYTGSPNQYANFKLAIYKSNDNCEGAEPIVLTNSPYDNNLPIYNFISASQSLPPCGTGTANDLWFYFTATQSSLSYIVSDAGTSGTAKVEVFSGSCGALTSIVCLSGPEGYFGGLTAGQQYYLRVYFSSIYVINRFKIRLLTAPLNDEITGARQLSVTNSQVMGLSNQLANGASPSFPNYCSGSTVTVNEDVWYYFVAPQTAQYLVNTTTSNQGDFELEAYNSKNNLQSNIISCGGITRLIPQTGNVNAGDTVWFRVYPNSSNGTYKGSFDLLVSIYNSTTINDEPADALDLPFSNSYQYTYRSFNYSLSSVNNSCLTPVVSAEDCWFKFNAPSLSASIVLDEVEGQKAFLEIFSGTPGSLTSIECADNILNLPASLIAGQQYYLRAVSQGSNDLRIGIFYNDTLEKNPLVAVHCLGPNLVPNPSAECTTCNVTCKGELITTGSVLAGYFNTDDWFMPTDGSADYMNSCANTYYGGANAPTSYITQGSNKYLWSDIVPRNGKGYLGIFTYSAGNYREYVSTELTQTLIPGSSYLVSFYVNKNYNSPLVCNKIGALLTSDRIIVTNNSSTNIFANNLPFEPQVAWNDSFYIGGDKWYNVSAIIVADKPYKYLTIGNFETNSGTSVQNNGSPIPGQFTFQSASYFNVEDVVVAEVPPLIDDSCKATLTAIIPVKPPAKTTLLIYPNPAYSIINYNINPVNNSELVVEVYSITGQIMYSAKTKTNSLSIENYLPGIYFIRINDGVNFYFGKFIKKN